MAGYDVYDKWYLLQIRYRRQAGCDSIISIDLTINNSVNGDTTTTVACDSSVWQGTTYTASGMYYDTLQTAAGCDSVLTLDLTINNSYVLHQ